MSGPTLLAVVTLALLVLFAAVMIVMLARMRGGDE